MANTHSTLASLFTDIAKAIRSKTGSSASIVADQFPEAISSIEVKENLDAELSAQDSLIAQINAALVGKAGVALPVLSNPAGAANIEAGYQAIDGSGNLIAGNLVPVSALTTSKFQFSTKNNYLDVFTPDPSKKYIVLVWGVGTRFLICKINNGTYTHNSSSYYGAKMLNGVFQICSTTGDSEQSNVEIIQYA